LEESVLVLDVAWICGVITAPSLSREEMADLGVLDLEEEGHGLRGEDILSDEFVFKEESVDGVLGGGVDGEVEEGGKGKIVGKDIF
jgi:hypothetical protein